MTNQLVITMPIGEFLSLIEESVKDALKNYTPAIQPKQDEKPITIKDVSVLMGKSTVTIHKWKKDGLIPFHRISGKVYFYESEILASLKPINRRGA